jgi:hypothetical protein
MGSPKLKSKKWLLWVILSFFSFVSLLITSHSKPEIDAYEIASVLSKSSVELQTIRREGFPFDILLAHDSTYNLSLELPSPTRSGKNALWLYTLQANNHGQVDVRSGDQLVGTVDNQLKIPLSLPVPKLSYIGELEVNGSDIDVELIGSSDKLDLHYAELGLVVLTRTGLTDTEVLVLLEDPGYIGPNFGLLLLILVAAFALLQCFSPRTHSDKQGQWPRHLVSALILLAIIFYVKSAYTPPNLPGYTIPQDGFVHAIESGFENFMDSVDQLQGDFLPDRQVNDDVPLNLRKIEGSLETTVYSTTNEDTFNRVSSDIFSGVLSGIQRMSRDQFMSLAFWALVFIALAIIADRWLRSRWTASLTLSLISTASVFISIRLSQGWDEFYINLRHAYMLNEHGVYSINANSMIEASVDFIPILLTGILGWTGFELVDSFIFTSLFGNIVVVIFCYLLVSSITGSRTWGLVSSAVIGLYPNVLWVGATGFSAVLFSGWIIASSYYILFTKQKWVGLALLSMLTLVRTEGILFAALLMAYVYVLKPLPRILRNNNWNSELKPAIKKALFYGALVASPFLLSLVIRLVVFGHAIPNPISFKNTNADTSYLSAGIERLTQMIINYDLLLLVILAALLLLVNIISWRRDSYSEMFRKGIINLLGLNLVIGLFILPYYSGGGDWFPLSWNRYGMPFNLIFSITILILIFSAFFHGLKNWVRPASLIVFIGALSIGYKSTVIDRGGKFLYSTLPSTTYPTDYRWSRVDNLASLGMFLRDTLPIDAVVSSPEVATIMYYSEREMIGLLGVGNTDITAMPFQPMKPGDILHRRRGYFSIYKSRPDVIALYEPVIKKDFRVARENLSATIKQSLEEKVFSQGIVNIAFYRVGSFSSLQEMGYRHFTIVYPDRLFSLFIHKRIQGSFIENLNQRNFKQVDRLSIKYSVNSELTTRLLPSVPQLLQKH